MEHIDIIGNAGKHIYASNKYLRHVYVQVFVINFYVSKYAYFENYFSVE